MNNLLSKIRDSNGRHSEEGMTVVEIMIAAIIIAGIFVFTATALTTSFKASSLTENKTRAANYADNAIAIAKQAPFRQLWVAIPPIDSSNSSNFGAGKCDSSYSTVAPTGTNLTPVTSGEGTVPFDGIVYCQKRQATNETNAIGATFYVQTDVRAYPVTGTTWQKHVKVTVKWKDVSSGEGKWNTYTTSVTRTPTVGECIPATLRNTGLPPGCVLP